MPCKYKLIHILLMISNIMLEHSFFLSLIIILFGPNYVVFTMSTVAIDVIVDQGHQYGCLMKRLDLRIVASEANFA